jgi:ACS family glucarate transporter-like MFS transporter
MNDTALRKPGFGFPVRYLLVAWIMVLSAVAFMDRTNVAISGIHLSRDFRIDNVHLGWLSSAFLIGYGCFQIPGGVLARRFGSRRLLAVSVTWWAVFIALTSLVPAGIFGALWILVAIRCVLGAGEAVMYPAANQFVERWFPMAERGKANGIIFAGVGLGAGLSPPLLTAIILAYGWRASFRFCATLGIVAGVVWYVAARNTPEQHPLVRTGELEHIVEGRGDLPGRRSGSRSRTPWGRICRSKEILAISFSYFAYGYVAWIFFSWFYIYLAQVRGLNLKTSALYSMLPFLAMTLGSLGGGVVSDWLARHVSARAGRCILPAIAIASTGALLVVGSRAHNTQVASLVLACGAGALYVSQSCFWSVTADYAGEHAGVVSGAMNMCGQFGGATTASLTPWIAAHFGWETSFLAATALVVLGGAAWLVVNPNARLLQPAIGEGGSELGNASLRG